MPRIMLVIGACKPQNYESIKVSVLEKLTSAEETGIRFCLVDDLSSEGGILDAMNSLAGNVDPDVSLDKRNADVAAIFEGDEAAADRLIWILSVLEDIKDRIGIWRYNYHLIWLAQEFPRLQYTYSELLKHLTGQKPAFQNIYFLSDRHSDLGHGKDIRVNGASLLLSTIQHTEHITPGFYTVGVGKNRITATEMRDYAKHQAVQTLRSQLFNWLHFTDLKDICASSFDDEIQDADGLLHWLLKQINSRMTSSFAYIKGETITHTNPEALVALDFSELLNRWVVNMVEYLHRIPFHEKVIDFFGDSGKFQDMLNDVEKRFYSYRTPEIKSSFFVSRERKNVIREYNTFRRMNQEEIQKGWEALKKQWVSCTYRIREEAEKLVKQRDDMLDQYRRDDQFLQLCEDIASETTRQIKQRLSKLEITSERFMSFSEDAEFTPAKADKMMSWIAEEVCRLATQENVFRDLTEKDYGQLVTQVFNPVISKSRIYLACASRENFNDPNDIYLHIPNSLYRERIPVQPAHIVPANSPEYQNVEALSLLKLSTDASLQEGAGKLTAFHGTAESRAVEREAFRKEPASEHRQEESWEPDTLEKDEESSDKFNPWKIIVQQKGDRYSANFVWDDPVNLITIRVENDEGYCKTLAQRRGDFLAQGDVDITDLVDYGKNTISLVAAGKVLSCTVFNGHRYQIEIEIEQSDFRLDQDTFLQKIQMTITSVDGDPKMQLSDSVYTGMRLLLDQKDLLQMPLPCEKHKQKGWTVILENEKSYMPVFIEEYASRYEIHII